MFTRRAMLAAGAAAAAAAPWTLRARAQSGDASFALSDDELDLLMQEEATGGFELMLDVPGVIIQTEGVPVDAGPGGLGGPRGMLDSEWEFPGRQSSSWNWWSFPQEDRVEPVWVSDDHAVDYAHLGVFEPPAQTAFTLTAAHLSWLAARNEFALDPNDPVTVIGLRGCALEAGGDDSGWGAAHRLRETRPDHKDFQCLIGVWNRALRQFRLFQGSTVPEVAYMWRQYQLRSGCNLLPTGLYAYQVGTHSLSSTRTSQVGALRLMGAWFPTFGSEPGREVQVLRTINDLSYDPTAEHELWDVCEPFDNIHSAVFTDDGLRPGASGAKFSSAGCQVLKGDYQLDEARRFTTVPRGPWAEFRRAAGLSDPPVMTGPKSTIDDGRRLHYMLLTGREAALAASGRDDFVNGYYRTRFGSSGPIARAVQLLVGAGADARIGPRTAERIVRFVRDELPALEASVFDSSAIAGAL